MTCSCSEEGYDDGYNDGASDEAARHDDIIMPLISALRSIRDNTPHQNIKKELSNLLDKPDYRWL